MLDFHRVLIPLAVLGLAQLVTSTAWANDDDAAQAERLRARGDLAEQRLDRKGDRLDQQLDRKGERQNRKLDRIGDRVDLRADRAAQRIER